MKRILVAILASLGISNLFAQGDKIQNESIATNFEKCYNENNYEAIFKMFDSEMQKALPLNETIEFLAGLKAEAGKIIKREFMQYDHTFASYKTSFEKGVFLLNVSIDADRKINGLLVKPLEELNLPSLKRNSTLLLLPFREEWTVIWGGDTKKQNYHVGHKAQKNALDLVITDATGKSFKTNGQANEDYYAFGKELIAPCDGEAVLVVDGIKDNKPGEMDTNYVPGNTVIIKTENNEFLFFAHFKQHSIKVQQGEKIRKGQLLGLCGNSGNSSEPHLHFHLQNTENMQVATGVKCFFEELVVNGTIKKDHSPIQNEKIKPVQN